MSRDKESQNVAKKQQNVLHRLRVYEGAYSDKVLVPTELLALAIEEIVRQEALIREYDKRCL